MANYSQSFLAGVGLIAVRWAKIENELKLHTSALAAQQTGGRPIDDLEIGFKRLRKLWLQNVREHMPTKVRTAEKIAERLAELSRERAIALHGEWAPAGKRGRYDVMVLRQNKTLDFGRTHATPALLRSAADRIADAYAELSAFTRGRHRDRHPARFLVGNKKVAASS